MCKHTSYVHHFNIRNNWELDMIETIIKRNGESEVFSPTKINGWGEWAAKSLGGYVDWADVVLEAVRDLPKVVHSRDLQNALITACLNRNTYSYNRMAGRLYAAVLQRDLYGKDGTPTIKEVHQTLYNAGFMAKLNYTDTEYAQVEKFIKHKRDFTYAHYQLFHIRFKYALRNRVNKTEMESPQFVFMRMAMALAENRPAETRMEDIQHWYDLFSRNIINAPTPNYVNLGTNHNGLASCCLITNSDTAKSIGIADHIAYTMTYMSAGIGHHLNTRSLGDPVRGGIIAHQGKFFYLDRLKSSIRANLQNGRGGACTVYFNAFDPEWNTILLLKHPMTPASKQIRGMDYNMTGNRFLARKAAMNEDVFTFNSFTAPDLYDAFYCGDEERFADIYAKYEADESFVKNYVSAREIIITSQTQALEVGRAYQSFADEINRHTPYKDPIYSSNLCAEIVEPTQGYDEMEDLYKAGPVGYARVEIDNREDIVTNVEWVLKREEDGVLCTGLDLQVGKVYRFVSAGEKIRRFTEGDKFKVTGINELKKEPEVALCSLAGIVITNVKNDEEYERAMYYALLMIDICIHKSTYELPHIGYTAKARMAAAVGIMDYAHHLARKKLKYTDQKAKEESHRVAERHMYFAIKASLRLGKELGNAPWIHRTKWTEGWIPLDTYQRKLDAVVSAPLQYDWEALRGEIIENGGIRNSTLVALMPGESSSKASGTVNSIYPIRELAMMKTDNNLTTYWCAPHSEKLGRFYQSAWDIPAMDMIEHYGAFQKFTDQAISADLFRKIEGADKVGTDEMLSEYFHMLRCGMKTRYYYNTHTSKVEQESDKPSITFEANNAAYKAWREKHGVEHSTENWSTFAAAIDGLRTVDIEGILGAAMHQWLSDNGLTDNTVNRRKFHGTLGADDGQYLLTLYPEIALAVVNDDSDDGVGCAGGGCTL